ncbi:AgmX/PglI C-terminal domain-containing protein [uncultured Abyssibacter sp.]|uniref:AgmX/PglI C-terminal domain-containing protein n=1 Tax=uncultured Abyssibacter sp. TaxID=2320202 RepID=UPI0032B2A7C6
MTASYALHSAWTLGVDETDRRFNRILAVTLVLFLSLTLAIQFVRMAGDEDGVGDELSDRYARLLLERAPPGPKAETQAPEPAAEEEPAEEPEEPEPEPEPEPEQPKPQERPQPAPTPEPTQETQVEQARERAEASGISQIRDAFADLRTEQSTAALTNPQALVTAAPTASGGARRSGSSTSTSELLSSASSGSSGIDTSQIARDGGGTGLASRETTRVQGPAAGGGGGGGAPARGSGGSAPGKGRPIDEIQIVFDRTKGAFYSIFNRARRQDPTLSGKVVVRLTIAPSGAVSAVEIVESQLNNADLESKILNRIRLMNFGAKDVPPITLDYPLFFEPG